uniref:BHLH domain-containing protein n=1 Tax=Cucumis sativus TaxID=3659 RepID=A0A0A0LJ57_CUCSA
MRSIHSFRSRRQATTISKLKPSRRRRIKLLHLPKHTSSSTVSATTNRTTPSAAMHKRLRNLQRLVPGHTHETNLNHLFQRTADYIHALQLKLNILKDLTSFYGL